MWPALWALWIAGNGKPAPRILAEFVMGVFVMRANGCAINDFIDRDIDPRVRRTRNRPLAARRISPIGALTFIGCLSLMALLLAAQLDAYTRALSVVGAGMVVAYPFLKRVFSLPQVFLGLSFGGWSIPMAFSAQSAQLPRVTWLLYAAAVLWTTAYDTIYAMVDREDDLKIGVHSSAIVFADMDSLLIASMQAMAIFALVLVGTTVRFGACYYGALAAVAVLFAHQQYLIRSREPENCLRAFSNNQYVGACVFVGIALHYLYEV
jgi:4-hydroxybenzoate polyprenyltransferase